MKIKRVFKGKWDGVLSCPFCLFHVDPQERCFFLGGGFVDQETSMFLKVCIGAHTLKNKHHKTNGLILASALKFA
jgi:hypothetical protein